MKLKIQQKSLLTILQRCAPIARAKSTMPVLSHVLLDAKTGKLVVSATDLYQSVQGTSEADVQSAGLVAVDACQLLDRVKVLDGEITIGREDKGGTALSLQSGSRKFRIAALSGDEYPALPDPENATELITLPGSDLGRLIERVKHAISPDETRLHLNSLLLERTGETLRAVATDGHRLATAESPTTPGTPFQVLVPLLGVSTVLTKLCEDGGDLSLRQQGYLLFISGGDYEASIKAADAQFPPWQNVIPDGHEGSVTIDREALLEAVRAVAVSASDRTHGVSLRFEAGKVVLSAAGPDSGEGVDEVTCERGRGAPTVQLGANARYLLDALGSLDGDQVELRYSGELDPLVIVPPGGGGVNVIMPMRI